MPGDHLSDYDLELYALGTLPASRLDAVEEHLLVCQHCISRIVEWEAFIKALRQAAERKWTN